MNAVNKRIIEVRDDLKLTVVDFCYKAKVSLGTYNNINNNENINQKTINAICDNLGVNKEWLVNGKGERYNTHNQNVLDTSSNNPYREALYKSLMDRISFYEEIIRNLTGMRPDQLGKLTGNLISLFDSENEPQLKVA